MTYLIDSDVVIDNLLGQPDAVSLISDLKRNGIAVSVISYMEVREGLAGGRNPHRAGLGLKRFLRGTRLLVVNRRIAENAADLRLQIRQQKRQVNERALDLLIAATAIEHNLILVTRNISDYRDIPGIKLYGQT